MAERPTQRWRQSAEEDAEDPLDCAEPDEPELFPESLLSATDDALTRFEVEITWPAPPADTEIFAAVERVVRDLNRINKEHDGCAYETSERDDLCEYINASLAESGVDVDALAARQGITRWEITDQWRRW